MSTEADEVFHRAIKLPLQELMELLARLAEAVDLHNPDLSMEWESEIARRLAEIDGGAVKMIPGEEVHRELIERRNARRRV